MPQPLTVGSHTLAIANAITGAVDRFRQGESSYLDIEVAFRHGKSDLSSRATPAFALGALQEYEPDIMLLSHSASLSYDFSRDVKSIIKSPEYQTLFPDIKAAQGNDAVQEWSVEGSSGKSVFTGLGGSFVGKGAHILIVDDWFAGKDEARSEKIRKKRWEGFTDALTRLAPVHIVLALATSWHTDGVRARLKTAEQVEPGFPQFEHLSFPAKVIDEDTGEWEGKYIFSERYSDQWYEAMYASQGHWASALLDCEPVTEGGNRFRVDNVDVRQIRGEDWPKGKEKRGWDLASSEKERGKSDPDWTWGVRGIVKTETMVIEGTVASRHHIWISDMVRCQSEAPERDDLIRRTAISDGKGVTQLVEAFGGYKDAYTTLKRVLLGISVVVKSHLPGDKSAKQADLEPSFDASIVHVLDGPHVAEWKKQYSEFPNGAKDDGCDATSVMVHDFIDDNAPGIADPRFYGRR